MDSRVPRVNHRAGTPLVVEEPRQASRTHKEGRIPRTEEAKAGMAVGMGEARVKVSSLRGRVPGI